MADDQADRDKPSPEDTKAGARLNKERILDVARDHFAREGFRKASLVKIASDLGVVKGALYYHVPGGKLAMFNAVMDREEERLIAAMRSAAEAEDDPRAALRAALDARLGVLQQLVELLGVRREIGEELSALTLAQERKFRRRERDLIEELIEKGEKAGIFAPIRPRRAAAAGIQAMFYALTIPGIYGRITNEGRTARESGGDDSDIPPNLVDPFVELILKGLESR